MEVVIKRSDRDEFYSGDGEWTMNRDAAKIFNDSVEAIYEWAEKKIRSEVVLSFRNPRFDVKLRGKE